MKTMIIWLIGVALSVVLSGCTTLVTQEADLNRPPEGVRVYPPKIYLLVDAEEKEMTVMFLPDYSRAYDIRPRTILSKQDFKVEMDDGQLKALTANQDTTAFLTFAQEGANLAAKAAGVSVSSTVIKGTCGLESGIYSLDDDGIFRKMVK